jgi:hypothetical protein
MIETFLWRSHTFIFCLMFTMASRWLFMYCKNAQKLSPDGSISYVKVYICISASQEPIFHEFFFAKNYFPRHFHDIPSVNLFFYKVKKLRKIAPWTAIETVATNLIVIHNIDNRIDVFAGKNSNLTFSSSVLKIKWLKKSDLPNCLSAVERCMYAGWPDWANFRQMGDCLLGL